MPVKKLFDVGLYIFSTQTNIDTIERDEKKSQTSLKVQECLLL